MKLLPTAQTAKQLTVLRKFLDDGAITLREPCCCGSMTRHNNGGNYHDVWDFKADAGKWFACLGSTSDYDASEWREMDFLQVLDLIQTAAAKGYN